MNASDGRRSRTANAALIGGSVALALLPLGALGSRFGMWRFTTGFLLLGGGLLLALLALGCGLVALLLAGRRQRPADRAPALLGSGLAVCVIGALFVNVAPGFGAPPIHDVSTDVQEPVAFSAALLAARGAGTNNLERSERVDAAQRAGFPALQSIDTDVGVDAAYQRALGIVEALGWRLVASVPSAGLIEATATTFWFGFRDDVAIRIRPRGAGARVDLRSVSRVGGGDLGANGTRIAEFARRFAASSG